jgi:hypothetical protein
LNTKACPTRPSSLRGNTNSSSRNQATEDLNDNASLPPSGDHTSAFIVAAVVLVVLVAVVVSGLAR